MQEGILKGFNQVFSLVSVVFVLLLVIPVVNLVVTADPAVLRDTVTDAQVLSSIALTLRAALWATAVCVVLGIPLAYILARRDFPGKSIVQGIIDLPVMIPHTAMGIALLMVYGRKFMLGNFFGKLGLFFVGTEAGISLAMAYVSLPLLVNSARDAFFAVDPKLESVARTLGASAWQTFFRITLPLSWRTILSGAIMMWARGISEFGAVVILTYHPMITPILIWDRFQSYGLKYASPVAVILILLCLVIFACLRWISGRGRGAF